MFEKVNNKVGDIMSYILLIVCSAFFLGLYDLFKKLSVRKKNDVYEVLFFYTFVACFCSLFFVKEAFTIDVKYIMFVMLKAGVISLSWFFTTKAMSKLDLGIVVPFSLLGVVSTTILAWVFFKESIGFSQIGGIFIILIGLFMISKLSKKDNNGVNDYKYLWLLVLAAFLSSISAIIDKHLLSSIDRGSVLFWFFFFLTIIYLIVCLIRNKKIIIKNFTSNLWVIGIGACIFLSDLFYYQAVGIQDASLSLISIIRKLSVFIGVVLASIFLKEKDFVKKLLILVLMFVGLSLIIFL